MRFLQDALPPGGVGRVARDEVVPGPLHVEHHREELALRPEPRLGELVVGHARLDVAERREPERVREPAGRVDGAHERAPARRARGRARAPRRRWSCRRRPSRRTPRCAGRRALSRTGARHVSPSSGAAPSASAIRSTASGPHAASGQERQDRGGQVERGARAREVAVRLLGAERLQPRGARGGAERAAARRERREPRLLGGVKRASGIAFTKSARARHAEHARAPARRARSPRSPASPRAASRWRPRSRAGRRAAPASTPRRAERPGRHGVEERRRDAEELDRVAGRRRVDDDEVPARPPALLRLRPRAGSSRASTSSASDGTTRRK